MTALVGGPTLASRCAAADSASVAMPAAWYASSGHLGAAHRLSHARSSFDLLQRARAPAAAGGEQAGGGTSFRLARGMILMQRGAFIDTDSWLLAEGMDVAVGRTVR